MKKKEIFVTVYVVHDLSLLLIALNGLLLQKINNLITEIVSLLK